MTITFVGSTTAAGASVTATTASITVPTGSNGDILIFHAADGSNASSGTNAPLITSTTAGLTKVQDLHTVLCGSSVFYRFVQAADPTSYTFTISSAAVEAITCSRYSGVSGVRSWNMNGQTDAVGSAATSIALPTSENLQATDLVIALIAAGRNALSATVSALSTPTGWTQRATKTGPTSSSAYGCTIAQYERLGVNDSPSFTASSSQFIATALVLIDAATPVPNVTGALPLFVSASSVVTASTNLKTLTVSKPVGVVDGHLLLLAAVSGDGVNVFTPPAGFRSLGVASAAFAIGATPNANDAHSQLWYKFASGEGASYTINTTGAQELAAVMLAYAGVRNPSPVACSAPVSQYVSTATPTTVSPAPYAISTVTPVPVDQLIVNFYCGGGDNTGNYTNTGPSGSWVQRAQVISAVSNDYNVLICAVEKFGATDVPTSTASVVLGWCVFSIALVGAAAPRHTSQMAFL